MAFTVTTLPKRSMPDVWKGLRYTSDDLENNNMPKQMKLS